MSHASLCFLSYRRAHFIDEAVRSAVSTAQYPCEVIVHDDGSETADVRRVLHALLDEGLVTRLILSPPGHNEGVGAAFNRCAKLATGQYVVKLDQDLLFKDGWLKKVIQIHEFDDDICGVGLFKYPVTPCRWQDMELASSSSLSPVPYHYVRDFVSSAISIPAWILHDYGCWPEHSDAFAEDVGWKTEMTREHDFRLALPDEDLAVNRGF